MIQFYTQNTSTTTFTPITGGTAVTNGTTADDERYVSTTALGGSTSVLTGAGLPIGFTFNFNGYAFDRFAINANGWITLGQSALGATAVNINSTSSYSALSATNVISPVQLRSRIAGFARDLQGQTGSSLRFETIGSAPNRVLVVQWLGFKRYSTTGTGDNFNFQIRLLEGSNNIEIVYGTMTYGSTSSTLTHMGISGNSNGTAELLGAGPTQTNGNALAFTNTSASLGWSVGGTNTAPTSGRRYTFTAPAVCSGTPVPGNTLASSNPACGNVGTTLSLQNNVGTGITYQWQSSPDGTTWNNVTGATGPTYSTGAMASDTYYRASVTCTTSAQTAFSNPVQVTLNSFLLCYCASTAAFTGSHDVLNVAFGTINNASTIGSLTGSQGTAVAGSTADLYSNFAGSTGVPVPSLAATQTYNLDLTVASTNTFSQTFTTKVWIDWNRDGDFTDGGEEVFNSGAIAAIATASAPRIFNTSIFTPVWVASGQTRMRVSTRTTSLNFDPCYTTGSGETEDYIVNLVALPVCSGTPTAGTANPSFANLCVGTGVNISLVGATVASGIQYQWQESPDNSSWTNISNAFGLIYQNTFSNPNLGAATITGNATITGGTMVLNPLTSNTFGSLLIPGTGAVSSQYRIKFDLNVSRPSSVIYADGVSYSFGDDVNPNNDANMNAENGTGSKLKLGFVTYTNGTSLNGIYLMYNCTTNEQTSTTTGVLAYSSDVSWRGVNTS
ncbi:MAG: GEVED domain-containing protein, partial [Bacteroidia bacterium]